MTIRPVNLEQRLKQVFKLESSAAVRATEQLLYEMALVKQHLPEVDTAFAEQWYQQRRSVNFF